jgi:hypothetical protein
MSQGQFFAGPTDGVRFPRRAGGSLYSESIGDLLGISWENGEIDPSDRGLNRIDWEYDCEKIVLFFCVEEIGNMYWGCRQTMNFCWGFLLGSLKSSPTDWIGSGESSIFFADNHLPTSTR